MTLACERGALDRDISKRPSGSLAHVTDTSPRCITRVDLASSVRAPCPGKVGVATRHAVVLLPGIVSPAEPAYAALLRVLETMDTPVVKDLQVYAADQPPPGYRLDAEVEVFYGWRGLPRFGQFHLVGYSAGGAASLAFVCPQRPAPEPRAP